MSIVCALNAAEFSARLDTRLTSFKSRPGDEFRATVTEPAVVLGRVLIPEGATLMGRVLRARSIGVGFIHERAELNIDVYAYRLPDGTVVACSAQVRRVDNARENTTADGRIRGILAAGGPAGLPRGLWRMPNGAMFQRPATRLAGFSFGTGAFVPLLSLGLTAARWTAFRFPEPEIDLPPGTELTFALTSQAPDAPDFDTEPVNVACARPWRGLSRNVRRTSGEVAEDLINVAISGTREQVIAAFEAAGWVAADPLNKRTFLRMYKAWTSMRGYPAAPVSRMQWEGRDPDLVFQKSLNTVARRHHIRIWQVPGRDKWIGAATHDVSINFDLQRLSLTHRIDPALDAERFKVYSDLRRSGCLTSASMIPLTVDSAAPDVETDGRIVRLDLGDCSGPTGSTPLLFTQSKPGNPISRMTRRFALETRQYIVRDNYVYWGFHAARAGSRKLVAIRRHRSERLALALKKEADLRSP